MKRSPMKRGTKGLKRSAFKTKVSIDTKGKKSGFKRKKKTPIRVAADRVWDLCRQIVWNRDGSTCVHCRGVRGEINEKGNTIVVNAHHWIVHDVASQESRYEFDNLVTLCSNCHLWKWHQKSDMRVFESIQTHMGQFMDRERYYQIMQMAGKGRVKRVLQDYLDLEVEFKEMLIQGEL